MGDPVQVHYDPSNPQRAALVPGLSWVALLSGGLGALMFLGFGAVLAYYGLKPD
ncbi:hypothetical protein U91I_01633 [alpha proteobacterium U9-1i]|nr:hypothetical protein U91I_01633 [alpha proteobacterium U9-1i]